MSRKLITDLDANSKNKRKGNQFDYSEVYRNLRTNIEFSTFENDVKVINVTSTNPGEGKSSVASNLALICAAKYDQVLLIDCDLRKPVQHQIFKASNRNGVSNIMKDIANFDVDDDRNYQKYKTGDTGGKLFLIPSGSKIPNPQELLSSHKFKALIEKFRSRFDFIIIDCPPINAVADAIPVADLCDGTLYVISSKDTNKNEAKAALTQLKRNGANIIGTVLTKVEESSSANYGYYYHEE